MCRRKKDNFSVPEADSSRSCDGRPPAIMWNLSREAVKMQLLAFPCHGITPDHVAPTDERDWHRFGIWGSLVVLLAFWMNAGKIILEQKVRRRRKR